MAQFWMVLFIASYNLLLKKAEGISAIYVTPNIAAKECFGTPCLDLKTYAHSASSFFVSNAQFNFLPGNHVLDSHIIVANKSNLYLIGSPNLTEYPLSVKVQEYGFDPYYEDDSVFFMQSSTVINCTGYNDTGFLFVNVTNLTIVNITFVNCGMYFSLTAQKAGISLMNIHDLLMEGVSIQNSAGYGLLGINLLGHSHIIMSSFIGNNQFVKNGLNKQSAMNFKCNGKAYTKNTVYYGNGDPNLAGGNMLIKYDDYGDYDGTNELNLSALVFSLGIDASFNATTSADSPGTGLALVLSQLYYVKIAIQNSTLYRNQAAYGANIYISAQSANFSVFIKNTFNIRAVSDYGSGLFVIYGLPGQFVPVYSSLYMHNVTFLCNYASSDGSSLAIILWGNEYAPFLIVLESCSFASDYSSLYSTSVELPTNVTFIMAQCSITDMLQTNTALYVTNDGKGLCTILDSFFQDAKIVLFSIDATITNSKFYNSKITASKNTIIALNGNNTFSDSENDHFGGAIYLTTSTIIFSPLSCVIFVNNSGTKGGAMYMSFATAVFSSLSYVMFVNNSATYGGAIYVEYESYLNYSSPTNVSFINNTALLTGGAIYVLTLQPTYNYFMPCFYQYNTSVKALSEVFVYFEENFAEEAGSGIYGGNIDQCKLDYCNKCKSNARLFDTTHHFVYHKGTTSVISSDPEYICLCDGTDCKKPFEPLTKSMYAGENISITFVTRGQRYGASPGIVMVYTDDTTMWALSTINQCKTYLIPYPLINGSLYLSTKLSFDSDEDFFHNITLLIAVLPCPAGFVMDAKNSSCTCDPVLRYEVYTCDIVDQTLTKSGSAWIGYNSQGDISVIDQCPSDYCSNASKISIFNFSSQCNYNRVGVACGQCAGNLSMTFGTSQCKTCSNVHLLLIIPLAFMGIVLIAFLMLFNLTVSSGTINGIILYAFVIRLYDNIFFPPSSGASAVILNFLSIFIAWLNLDLGIETCFYDGMNSYSKIWLQFSFPLYMVVLIALIIVATRWSSLLSKICRYNMTPVISTLIIMFYAKLLRVVAIIFKYAAVKSNYASHHVWNYDGSVSYLGLNHAFLCTAGLLVSIFFILPYTAVMLLTPCLVRKSHWKVMCWMNKLKPFIDCYEAPFKDRYRFWTGATLFYRIVFCILFILFPNNQPVFVLLIIIVIHASMIVMVGLTIYKHWLVSLLEGFIHINIVTHSLALFFLNYYYEHNSPIPTMVCVSSVFISFLCIIFFKAFHYVWKKNYFNLQRLYYSRLIKNEAVATSKETSLNKESSHDGTVRCVYRAPLSDEDA